MSINCIYIYIYIYILCVCARVYASNLWAQRKDSVILCALMSTQTSWVHILDQVSTHSVEKFMVAKFLT